MNTKSNVIAFPPTGEHGFTTDDTIELTERLQLGVRGRDFSEADLDFIESWAGDDSSGTFYNIRITAAYGIEQETGSEPGEYTWPKLAAMLRKQKAATGTKPENSGMKPQE